jgi:hypothetical protein
MILKLACTVLNVAFVAGSNKAVTVSRHGWEIKLYWLMTFQCVKYMPTLCMFCRHHLGDVGANTRIILICVLEK